MNRNARPSIRLFCHSAAVSVAAFTLLLSACSTQKRTFAFLDRDRDARISRSEFKVGVQGTAFDQIDSNQDGMVSRTEWRSAEAGHNDSSRRFNRLDKDRSGSLTRREFSSFREKHLTLDNLFGTLDSDDDGYLSSSELEGAATESP